MLCMGKSFRSDNLDQALLLCEKAGLVKLEHVAIDGSKIKANASKHKAMSCRLSWRGGRAG